MDREIKEQADRLFNELGFNLTTAINAFVKQALRDRVIPFYTHLPVNGMQKPLALQGASGNIGIQMYG